MHYARTGMPHKTHDACMQVHESLLATDGRYVDLTTGSATASPTCSQASIPTIAPAAADGVEDGRDAQLAVAVPDGSTSGPATVSLALPLCMQLLLMGMLCGSAALL